MNEKMNEKDFKKMLENVGDAMNGDLSSICEFVLTTLKRHKGNLKDCLKEYDSEQLEVINKMYNEDYQDFRKLKKGEKIASLEETILDSIKINLNHLTTSGIQEISELIKDENYQLENNILIGTGIVYRSVVDGKSKYYIPTDVKKIIKNHIDKGAILESVQNDCHTLLISAHSIYGLVPKEIFISKVQEYYPQIKDIDKIIELLKKNFKLHEINGKEYFWPSVYPVLKEAKKYLNNHINLSYEETVSYFYIFSEFLADIFNIIKPKDMALDKALSILTISEKNLDEIIDSFTKEYNLKSKQKKELREYLEILPNIRYWSLGGRTTAENELKYFILDEKPKEETLEGCLKSLKPKALEILYDKYEVSRVEELENEIFEGLICEALDDGDKELILGEQNQEYQNIIITPYEITQGYYYLYKDDGKVKVFIPTDIEDYLNQVEDDEEELDGHNLISLYMMTNGIIKKEKLRELLKQNHGLEYSIEELDQEILDYEYTIFDDYYSLMDDVSDFEKSMIIVPKEGQKYKPVDYSVIDSLELLTDLSFEIESYLNKIAIDTEDKKEFVGTIMTLLQMGIFNKELIKDLMEKNNFKLDKKTFNDIISAINRYKNDIPIWIYNGYTKKELNNMPKKTKIGRNDPCPCGSGKKYKKCCGK